MGDCFDRRAQWEASCSRVCFFHGKRAIVPWPFPLSGFRPHISNHAASARITQPREEVDIPAGGDAAGSAENGSRSGKMRRKAGASAGQRQQQQQQSPEANPPPANHAQDGAGADVGRHADDVGSVGDCGEDFGGEFGGGGSVDGDSCNEMDEGGSHAAREEEGRVASVSKLLRDIAFIIVPVCIGSFL